MSPSDAVCEMTALAGSSGRDSPIITQCQSHHHQSQFGSPVNASAASRQERHQRCRPTIGCLVFTAFFTLVGTSLLTASIFTDYWERIDYNATAIETVAQRHNGSHGTVVHRLTWLFNGTVRRRSSSLLFHYGCLAMTEEIEFVPLTPSI